MKKFELINISKSFSTTNNGFSKESLVLDNISFNIEPGTITSILGPSGCGKSTLLNLMAGFLEPTKGIAKFNGNEITSPNPERVVIFQEYGLFDWKTVQGNIEFGLKAKGILSKERKSLVERYIDLVHLRGAEDKYPLELSGGMKQRAAIARAIAVEPECLLMDEPFGALDSQTRNIIQDEILAIWREVKNTIVSITHNIDEAVYLSDRIIVLSNIPARVILDLQTNLKRPREPEIRISSKFREIHDMIWQTLRNEIQTTLK
ncbi:MAG: ABC transporter ATP-binding protein [Bacteroidia bacterium]|nr:ABC transporter ATP-binding protein [Bacteroidia bacterium]